MTIEQMEYAASLIENGVPDAYSTVARSLGTDVADAFLAGHLIFDEGKPSQSAPAPGMESFPDVIRTMRRFGVGSGYRKALGYRIPRESAMALVVSFLRHEAREKEMDVPSYARRALMRAGLTVQFRMS